MRAILLDGSTPNDHSGASVANALMLQLQHFGWKIEYVSLREKKIGNCSGDFFCWIRSPGMCHMNDDNRELAASIVGSDLLVYLTPVTFGGYSSVLKKMVDHQIQNISPFFVSLDGEIHHEKRYSKYPNFLAVGWLDSPDEKAELIFKNLVQRNAINFYAKTVISEVLRTKLSIEQISKYTQKWLLDLKIGKSSLPTGLPAKDLVHNTDALVRRALLLVGSPRSVKSNSNSIGSYLFEQLKIMGIEIETIYIYSVLHSAEKLKALLDAVDASDLIVLAFPLYVDSLPAPVIEILEFIASDRKDKLLHPQMFASIANCGFPEAAHNKTALGICETFARQVQFGWAGSLALGGGEALGGLPLIQGGGRTTRIRKALDMAAMALGAGKAIPVAAQELLEKPIIPKWVYCMMGGMGWRKLASRFGVSESLNRQPYLTKH